MRQAIGCLRALMARLCFLGVATTMNFIPEMHDIGKLVDTDKVLKAMGADSKSLFALSGEEGGHCFQWIDWGKTKYPEPATSTWQGIRYHHDQIGDNQNITGYPLPDAASKQNLFCLLLADHLAAATSRSITNRIPAQVRADTDGVYRLWNPGYYAMREKENPQRRGWAAADDEPSLATLLDQIKDPNVTSERFLRDYAYWLTLTPEDKKPPRNVTSLHTHVELVGKFYRALRGAWTNLSALAPIYQNQSAQTITQAELRWRYRVIECRFHFPQTLVRAVDLNVFLQRQQLMDELQQQCGDNVLLRTADTALLFLPAEESLALRSLAERFLAAGLGVDCRVAETALALLDAGVFEARGRKLLEQHCAELNEPFALLPDLEQTDRQLRERLKGENKRIGMTARGDKTIEMQLRKEPAFVALQEEQKKVQSELDRVRNALKQLPEKPLTIDCIETSLHSDLAPVIAPPLCEVCQMRPATTHWPPPDVETDLRDDVCDKCFSARNMGRDKTGKSFSNLSEWDELEQSVDVAWVRFFLADYETLGRIVRDLFEQYVDQGPLAALDEALRAQVKENLRTFALLADFTNDYRALLDEFFAWLKQDEGGGWFPKSHVESLEDGAPFKDLYVLRVEKGAAIGRVIERFQELLTKYFPKCADAAPVRLAISVSNVKYPYNEHWRFLEKPAALINLQMPTRNARLVIGAGQLMTLQKIELGAGRTASSRFLHDLVEQERISGTRVLPQAMMLEAWHKEEKEMRAHRATRHLPEDVWREFRSGQLTARQILDYYKIVGW